MEKRDQAARLKGTWTPMLDKKNTAKLKQIVKKYGWPTLSLVGEKGAHAAWLIVQHSPDLYFQKKCLKKMRDAMEAGEAERQDVAYLIDRVLVREKKGQLFGTQFRVAKNQNRFEPFPIHRRAYLNRRRLEYGLGDFKSYAKKFHNSDVARFKTAFQKSGTPRKKGSER